MFGFDLGFRLRQWSLKSTALLYNLRKCASARAKVCVRVWRCMCVCVKVGMRMCVRVCVQVCVQVCVREGHWVWANGCGREKERSEREWVLPKRDRFQESNLPESKFESSASAAKRKKLSGSSSGVQFLGNSVASTSSHFFLAWPSRALFFGAGLERNIRPRLGFRLKALPKILGSVIRSTKVNKDPFLGSKVLFSFLLAGPSSKRTWTDSMKNRLEVKSRPTATTSAANSRLWTVKEVRFIGEFKPPKARLVQEVTYTEDFGKFTSQVILLHCPKARPKLTGRKIEKKNNSIF